MAQVTEKLPYMIKALGLPENVSKCVKITYEFLRNKLIISAIVLVILKEKRGEEKSWK